MNKKDLLATFTVRCSIIAAGFFVSIFTAHFLGPTGRGSYFYIITLSTLFVQLGSFGMQSSNIYLIAKNKQLLGQLATNNLWIAVTIGCILASLIPILIKFSNIEQIQLWFLVILVPALLFYQMGSNLLVGINNINLFNLYQLGSNLTAAMAVLATGLLGYGIKGFLTAITLVWLSACLLLIFQLKALNTLQFKFDFNLFANGLKFALKVYISTLLGILVLKSNVFFLQQFSPLKELGYYSIAAQISDALVILPASCALLLFPDLIRNKATSWKKTQNMLVPIGIFMLITCLIISFAAKIFIPILFGSQFLPAVSILNWMLPGAFFLSLISITSQYLAANGFPISQVICWFIAFAIILVTSWILIPRFGGQGAGMALSLTYGLLCAKILGLGWYFSRKERKGKIVENIPEAFDI